MLKRLPHDLTSYDFLKAFAIILTVIDHVGYYFYPDELWFRAAGRLCVPVWFFLIGYAQSRDLGWRLWGALALLLAANVVAGMSIAPLPILAVFLFVRLCIDRVAQNMMKGAESFWGAALLFCALALPSGFVAEYGLIGLLFALCGWMMRRQDEMDEVQAQRIAPFLALCTIAYVVVEQVIFGFSQAQLAFLSAGMLAVMGALSFFRAQTYPALSGRLPGVAVNIIHILGRRTLEIYVIHLILFKALGILTQPDRFILWNVKFFSITGT